MQILLASAAQAFANTDCSGYQASYPDHYCECYNDVIRLTSLDGLKDLHFADSIWFKTGSQTFIKAGMTAYLFSETDVQVDIYQNCKTDKKLYSFTVPKNQTRDMDHQSILDRLEQNGVAGMNTTIYVLFYPVEQGADCRLMCYPYNTGPNSTPEDPLPVLTGMTYVSSHAYDVYELKAENIPASCALYTQWVEPNNLPCHLRITRGSVDGAVIAEHDFASAEAYYHFDMSLLAEVRAAGESLYMHYTHDAAAAGRIITNEVFTNHLLTDIVICQGKGWEYAGQTYTQPIVIPYDTVWTSTISRDVYAYNLIVEEPQLQYDTLALPTTQLPYTYHDQTIANYGDYELHIQSPGECHEHIMLHVRHRLTTITTSVDTTLCEGKPFVGPDGKNYLYDITFTDSVWHNQDTLYVNHLNVYFNAMDIIHDTLRLKMNELPTRLYGTTIREFGDYKFLTHDANLCPDSLYLHICHDLAVRRDTVEKILCQGMVYEHTDGAVYTSAVTLVDTVWTSADAQTITITQVQFVSGEMQRDTLALKTTDLPYTYRGKQVNSFGEHDLYFAYGECEQLVRLMVLHNVDTVRLTVDTVLCEGMVFDLGSAACTTSSVLTEMEWTNPDTYQITTYNVVFTPPVPVPDTLALNTTELPYLYRDQAMIDRFGDHDITLTYTNACDERYLLHVAHRVDTIYQMIDTLLCQGRVYEYKGVAFTADTMFVDTVAHNVDTCMIYDVLVEFTAPETQRETLYLKHADLPYLYRGQYTIPVGGLGQEYDVLLHYADACDERYLVDVVHAVDTLHVTIDTTLCQGMAYDHHGELHTAAATLLHTEWLDADTYQITTTRLHFAAPEAVRDTLALKTTDLPYLYRNQQVISDFGNYDITLRTPGACDERYLVHVAHRVDTIYQVADSTICYYYYAPSFEYEGKWYTTEMTFTKLIQLNADTVLMDVLNVRFADEPMAVYDTLALRASQFPYKYQLPDRSYLTIKNFGDYDKEYEDYYSWCVEHLYLHVYPAVDTVRVVVDTTLCQGMSFTYGAQTFTRDTAFVETAQLDDITYQITSVSVHFAAPEAVRDTLALKTTELPYLYRNQEVISAFGDYDITIHTPDACDERYLLCVYHQVDTLYQSVDTTLCQGMSFTYGALTIVGDTTFVETSMPNEDTYLITTLTVIFTAPEAVRDTLTLKTTDLPYLYRNQQTIAAFGDYDITIHTPDACDERYLLCVWHQVDTVFTAVDTTLCQGRVYTHNEVEYTVDTTLVDYLAPNEDMVEVQEITLVFVAPEMEYDTLLLTTEQLLAGYHYEPADTMIYAAGEYFFEIVAYNECTRHLTLTVNEEILSSLDELPAQQQPRLIMHGGKVYILRGKQCFTLLGEPVRVGVKE